MPITPFHFGPGALLHAAAPGRVSFLSFCAANVLIDCESLYNLVHQRHPVHAFLHTYMGATLVIPAIVLLFIGVRWLVGRSWLPMWRGWRELHSRKVAIGAALGAYSHVALDSVMHSEIQPLAPWSFDNPLLGVIPLGTLHLACAAAGALGIVLVAARRLSAGGESVR